MSKKTTVGGKSYEENKAENGTKKAAAEGGGEKTST